MKICQEHSEDIHSVMFQTPYTGAWTRVPL